MKVKFKKPITILLGNLDIHDIEDNNLLSYQTPFKIVVNNSVKYDAKYNAEKESYTVEFEISMGMNLSFEVNESLITK